MLLYAAFGGDCQKVSVHLWSCIDPTFFSSSGLVPAALIDKENERVLVCHQTCVYRYIYIQKEENLSERDETIDCMWKKQYIITAIHNEIHNKYGAYMAHCCA